MYRHPPARASRASTLEQQRQEAYLNEQEKQHFTKLRRLLSYTRYPLNTHAMLGRCTQNGITVLCWPQITDLSLRHMRRDFYNDDQCIRECESLAIHTPDVFFIMRRLKETIEELVAPVLLSPFVRSSQQLIHAYAQKVEGLTGLTRDAGFRDPMNYTLFQRPTLSEKTHVRLFTPPVPLDVDVFADCMPAHLLAFQEMWHALSHRHESAFDSFDAGVTYLSSGLIAVNWLRYARAVSQSLVPGVAPRVIDARALAAEFDGDSRRLGRILAAKHDTPVFTALYQQLLSMDLCGPDDQPFLTFFDPLFVYMGKHERLFKGAWHYHHKAVVQKKRELLRRGLRERDPSALPRALPLTFKPYEFIRKEVESGLLPAPWFDKDYVETLYTVKSRREFCFRRPSKLSEAASRCPAEAEAWKRTLDAFHLIEVVNPNDPASISELNPAELKSEFFKRARLEFLDKAAGSIIKDYKGLDTLRRKEMKEVKKKAQQMFVQDQATQNTTKKRWYHDGILQKERETIARVVDLRAQVTVRFPDSIEPKKEVFFRPTAIRMFLRFVTPPMPSTDKGVEPVRDAIDNAWRPAPYVLAWARFCTEVITKAEVFGNELRLIDDTDLTAQWTPKEDIALLMGYRAYPAMTHDEWHTLLGELRDRTQAQAYQHITALRRVLKRVLQSTSLARLWPGSIAGDEAKARQVMFIYGAAQKLKIRNSHDNTLLGRILRLTPDQLLYYSVPSVYSLAYFRNFRP